MSDHNWAWAEPTDPRILLIKAVQEEHDMGCIDYSCPCAGENKEWHEDLQVWASAVAIAEADALIAEIEEAAVRRYRGFEE